MSEVKRYEFVYKNDFGNEYPAFPRLEVDGDYIEFADFDRVTAELKEGIAKHWNVVCDQRAKIDTLQQRLTAADERADVLETALRKIKVRLDAYAESDMHMPEPSVEVCQAIADAALKPEESPLNQCDGCQAGIPVVNGAHRMGKPGGYPDTMSCTARLYVEERPDGCCCPPKGHTGLWAAAMCPVHHGLRAKKP